MKTVKFIQHISFRNIAALFLISIAASLTSCEGEIGPMGPPGEDGGLYYGTSYELTGDFTAENGYSLFFDFPEPIYESDVVLVYMFWEQDNGLNVWRLLPQTIFLDNNGLIYYNFDYTIQDVKVFMEGTSDVWVSGDTDNHYIKIAVVPADFIAQKSVDVNVISTIIDAPNLKLKNFDTIDLGTDLEEK